jgi:hypothetical protein
MPITVKFDPQSVSQQAQIIPDATEQNVGLMTPAQVKKLAGLHPPVPPPPPSPIAGAVLLWGLSTPWADVYAAIQKVNGIAVVLVEAANGPARQMTDNGGAPTILDDVVFIGLQKGGNYVLVDLAPGGNFVFGPSPVITSKDIFWQSYYTVSTGGVPVVELDGGGWGHQPGVGAGAAFQGCRDSTTLNFIRYTSVFSSAPGGLPSVFNMAPGQSAVMQAFTNTLFGRGVFDASGGFNSLVATPDIQYDASSFPNGNVTVQLVQLQFVAGTPADWAGSPPATIQAAIDRLGTAVAGLLGVPIP